MVEPVVAKSACPLCKGTLRVQNHGVHMHDGESLREIRARCSRCASERMIFFRIALQQTH